jgi:transporter family-2 protein
MAARPLTLGSLVLIVVFSGFMNSLQARANGELARHLGNGVQAALFSFASGLVVLTIAVAFVPSFRAGVGRIRSAARARRLPWWAMSGGFLGGTFIACQSFATALVGVALFSVGMVAGQTANSLIVDRIGLSPIGKTPVSRRRILSAFVAVGAVMLAVSGRASGAELSVPAMAAAFVGGCLVAVQQALNGRVNVASQQPVATTWLNFVFGTLGLLLGVAVSVVAFGASISPPSSGPGWMYLGGVFGLVFIITAAWSVPRYGVLVFALVTIAGQMTSAVLLDVIAPVGGNSVTLGVVAGVLLTYVAVLLGALGRR